MSDELNSLEDLKTLTAGSTAPAGSEGSEVIEAAEVIETPLPEPKIDPQGRSYATGKRKNAIARVWIKPGTGKITINGRDQSTYFARPVLRMILAQPFEIVERVDQFDVVCTVKGGGLSGQAGAVRHGVSKALTYYEPALRPALKKSRLHDT